MLSLAEAVPAVGVFFYVSELISPITDGLTHLEGLIGESEDVNEALRTCLSIRRFIAALSEPLSQLEPNDRSKVERELKPLLALVEEFKAAIMSLKGKEQGESMLARAYQAVVSSAKAPAGIALVSEISKKISTFFSSLKGMLGVLQNRAIILKTDEILRKLSQPPNLPMFEAAKSQISQFQAANPGASDEAAAAALEADPDKVQALAIAGGVSPEAFEGAMVEMKDVMGEHHAEAMANAKHYGEKLAAGQAAIRGELQQVKKCIFQLGGVCFWDWPMLMWRQLAVSPPPFK